MSAQVRLTPEEVADLVAEAATGDAEQPCLADLADIKMEVPER